MPLPRSSCPSPAMLCGRHAHGWHARAVPTVRCKNGDSSAWPRRVKCHAILASRGHDRYTVQSSHMPTQPRHIQYSMHPREDAALYTQRQDLLPSQLVDHQSPHPVYPRPLVPPPPHLPTSIDLSVPVAQKQFPRGSPIHRPSPGKVSKSQTTHSVLLSLKRLGNARSGLRFTPCTCARTCQTCQTRGTEREESSGLTEDRP